MSVARGLFHTAMSTLFIWAAYTDIGVIAGPSLPIRGNYFSKIVWLTIVDLYIQLGYHFYSIYLSCCSKTKQRSATWYHFMSNTVVFPAAFTVGIMFWVLYLTHRDLLIPEGFEDPMQTHPAFNHAIHSLPACAMFLDHLLWNHGRTAKGRAVVVMTVFASLYIIDIHVVHAISGFWPYGILGMLSVVPRTLFLLSGVAVMFGCFLFGDLLNAYAHPSKGKRRD